VARRVPLVTLASASNQTSERARFVVLRLGTEAPLRASRHLWFQSDYGVSYAGKFLKETQPGRNLSHKAVEERISHECREL
jgi:hypothetical protein